MKTCPPHGGLFFFREENEKQIDMLRIAIQSKGRLNEESLSLLQSIGIEVDAPKRKLLSKSQTFPIEALYLRDDDIPHVVESGTATLGIVGLNEVEERGAESRGSASAPAA